MIWFKEIIAVLTRLNELPSVMSALIWASIGGMLCALVVGATCRLLPRLSPFVRTWLWWLVCLKFVLGLYPTFAPVTVASLPNRPLLMPQTDDIVPSQRAGSEPNATQEPSEAATPISLPDAPREPQSSIPVAPVSLTVFVASTLLVLWLGGVLIRLGIAVWQYATVHTLIVHARPLENASLNDVLRDQCAALKIRSIPRLLQTLVPVDPLIAGVRRPVILLADAHRAALSEPEIASILAHELAHLKRGDLWLGLIPLAAQTLFWFLPPVWWCVRAYEIAREGAADALALSAVKTPPAEYGRLLLKMSATFAGSSSGVAALFVSAPFRAVEGRLRMLERFQSEVRQSGAQRRPARTMLALATCVVIAGLVPWRLVAAEPNKINSPIPPGSTDLSPDAETRAPQAQNLNFARGLTGWTHVQSNEGSQEFQTPTDFAAALVTNAKPPLPGSVVKVASTKTTRSVSILGQNIAGAAFAGKRVRFSAYLKTEKAEGAGLWIRLDASDWQQNWAFNMPNAPLTGTKPWKRYSLVFDVPQDARGFAFGIEQAGVGTVWATGISVEAVSKTIPVSPASWDSRGPRPWDSRDGGDDSLHAAQNLNFSEGLKGWGHTANGTDSPVNSFYTVGVDTKERYRNAPSGFVMATQKDPLGYGALRQDINATPYRNKRIRFRTRIKPVGIVYELTPLLAVYTPTGSRLWVLHGHTMPKSDNGWLPYSFVADVPADANMLMIGLSMKGEGKGYLNNVALEVVDKTVPLSPLPDFEKF